MVSLLTSPVASRARGVDEIHLEFFQFTNGVNRALMGSLSQLMHFLDQDYIQLYDVTPAIDHVPGGPKATRHRFKSSTPGLLHFLPSSI